METPDKIYLYISPFSGYPLNKWYSEKQADNDVEYTRTDVIVERAEKYLHEHLVEYWSQRVTDGSKFIEDFKDYMKGEKE